MKKKKKRKKSLLELERQVICISYSSADYYANLIPSVLFWSGPKEKIRLFVQIETGLSLAAKRRAEALHLVSFQPSIRAYHDDLVVRTGVAAAAECVS